MRGYSYEWLRVTVWFVLLATLCGNLVVIVVLVTGRSKMTVPKFLMCSRALLLLLNIFILILLILSFLLLILLFSSFSFRF